MAELDEDAQARVALQHRLGLLLRVVPDVDALVAAGDGQESAVAAPAHAVGPLRVVVAMHFFTCLQVEGRDDARPDRDLTTVGVEKDGACPQLLGEALDLPA